MKIVKVKTKKHLNVFLSLIDFVHQGEINYISPLKLNTINALDEKKNPLWKEARYALFIAFLEEKPVGRIAAIYNRKHNEIHKDNCGYFGFFEVINNETVAKALLDEVKMYLQLFNCKKIIGPLNPSVNYELGVLIKGFDKKPFFMMNYNQAYYAELLEKLGGKTEMCFKAYKLPCELNTEKIERVTQALKNRYALKIEDINFSQFAKESTVLCQIYNDAFEDHWGFLPFSEEEFLYMAKDMKMIMDKKLIFKIKVGEEVAGFILALPNINEAVEKLRNGKITLIGALKFLYYVRKIKWVKVMVVAIRGKYKHFGLGSVLYTEMAKRVKAGGYEGGELSWVADENTSMNKVIKSMGAEATKEYKVYRF